MFNLFKKTIVSKLLRCLLVLSLLLSSFNGNLVKADPVVNEVSVKLGDTPIESGIIARAGDNGAGLQTGTAAGKTYWKTNKAAGTTYLYMNVDDAYLFDNTDQDIQAAIEYYDEGSGSFSIQYDSQGAAFKDAPIVSYGNTHQWKTYTFLLKDGKFANRTNGADFRINIEGGGINADLNPDLLVASVAVTKVLKDNGVNVKLGATPIEQGIAARPGDNGAGLQTGTVTGNTYWKTNKAAGTTYLYMNVDNAYLFQNVDKDVIVSIEYYDEGSGSFSIQYDSQGPLGFKDAQTAHYGNTQTWKTYSYKLEDAYFGDRTNGSDFRIGIEGGNNDLANNSDLLVSSVTVKKIVKNKGKAKVINTIYPTDDIVIANFNVKDFGALGNGTTDDTDSFTEALNAAKSDGGGVVFVPAGQYKIAGNLKIPTGVTLRGDWNNPDSSASVAGTIIMAYANKGDENANSFITLEQSSGIRNLSIWYPEQDFNNVAAYPWTIEQLPLDNATIENVTLVNSYKGIKIGPDSNELHYIKNLYATTLKTGIFIDVTTDIGRIQDVHLSPKYWSESLLPGAPSGGDKAVLFNYMTSASEGIVMGRSDWEYMNDIHISGYKTGMRITTRTNSLEAANAQLYHIYIEECNVALQIEGVNAFGLLISDSSFKATIGDAPKDVFATSGFGTIVQFNTVTFGGNPLNAVVNEGTGVLSFENSTFENWRNNDGGYAIKAESGSLILGHTQFLKPDKQILLQTDVSKVTSINSGFQEAALVIDNQSTNAEIDIHRDNVYTLENLPANINFDKNQRPKPASSNLYDVTSPNYNAINDGSADVSDIIIQALADAQATGGTVYFPAGIYRVDKSLTVPAGVELRGMWDVPHHTSGGGSVLFTNYGENAPNGTPFITLEANAGIRGLSVYYDKQNYNNVKPYSWTIQGKGHNVYAINTTLVNPYQGIDFGSYDTSGHYIDYVGGSPLKEGIFLGGGSQDGFMRNVQFNPHYYSRSDYPNHVPGDLQDIVWNYQKENLDAFHIGNVKNEHIFDTFVFGSQYGMHFVKQDGVGPQAIIMGHGTDGSKKGVYIEGAAPEGLKLINTELVSLSTSEKVYITAADGFDSEATFFNSAMWGSPTRSVDIYGGKVKLQQSNFQVVGQRGINALGGDITLFDSYFQEAGTTHIYAGEGIQSLIEGANIFKGGLKIENHSLGKVKGTDLFPVTIELAPVTVDPNSTDGLNTRITLSNLMDQQALNGQIEVIAPNLYQQKFVPIHFENLGFGQHKDIDIPFIISDSMKFKVSLDDGRSFNITTSVGQTIALNKAVADTNAAPLVELNRADQYIGLGKKWGGSTDLSALTQVKWDADKLYLSIAVKDNVHAQTWAGGDIWQGDSVQLGFDLSRKAGASSTNVNELGFALKNDGTITKWRWRAPEGMSTGAFIDAEASITRDEVNKMTQYDIAIPISSLYSPGVTFDKKDPIGFSLLINENDGAGRAGFMEYNHGIGSSKDATQFGDLYLIEHDYKVILENSANSAVNKAKLIKDTTSIDAAECFVNLLAAGALKQSLTDIITALRNPISAPAGVSAAVVSAGSINITWTAVSGAASYNVYRSTSLNGAYAKVNASDVVSNSYLDTGLIAGATYYYKVTAIDAAGETDPSNAVFAITKLNAPTGLEADAKNTKMINLSWNKVTGASSYNVYRSLTANGTYVKVNTSAIGINKYADTNLSKGTTYYYKVTALNAGGESVQSNSVSETTKGHSNQEQEQDQNQNQNQ